MSKNTPYELDDFQVEAIEALDKEKSVLVTAPTSSGKTLVAEHAIDKALESSKRLYYTAPIKALCNQKFRDFSNQFGTQNVGLLTGDHSVRSDAKILVMTTEVLRNMLYTEKGVPRDLYCVVLDEIHFLEDPYRGAVWEEIILTLPKNVLLIALSATVSNAGELNDWISSVRGEVSQITREKRPVPLKGHYMASEKNTGHRLVRIPILKNGRPNNKGAVFKKLEKGKRRAFSYRWTGPRRSEIVNELEKSEMLPAIFFIFSRKGCDDARDASIRYSPSLNSQNDSERALKYAEKKFQILSPEEKKILGVNSLLEGFKKGFASHHAGLLPLFKQTTEELFSMGLLKVVFATETLAVGVNMPAKSVVIEKLTKFNGDNHELLTPSQFTQLTGRAGRRGIDEEGHTLTCWSPFVSFDEVVDLTMSKNFRLSSAFTPTYNMLANLLATRSEKEASRLLASSFAQFQMKRSPEGFNRDLIEQVYCRLDVLEETGLADGWKLTNSGLPLIKIFNEYDLLITKCISDGIFEGLDEEELASIVSCFVFSKRGREGNSRKKEDIGKISGERIKEMMTLNERIAEIEMGLKIEINPVPDLGFAKVIQKWVSGADLTEVMSKELSAGEFVRNLRLSMDLLQQIANVSTLETKQIAVNAIESIERGVVVVAGEFDSGILREETGRGI